MNKILVYLSLALGTSIVLASLGIHQQVNATGGGTELAKIITPLIQQALDAIEQGDYDTANDLLKEAIEQAKDSYDAKEASPEDG